MTILPAPEETLRITRFLQDHVHWSVFWDKKGGVWRVAEDDPDSDLYTASSDLDTVIGYIAANSEAPASRHAVPSPPLHSAECSSVPR
jgi:hypothetical protein